ncbi:MAG: hypothetical protein M3238_06480 [Actinomycetota bacterium]|nr:hypothetical protein [Actinomycetota bacterium]
MSNEKLLRIYLNDHLAGSLAGIELAKRARSSNEGTPLGDYLAGFIAELEEDRTDLVKIIDALGFPQDRLKLGGAWLAEKVGRLKLNGQLTGYSDLSRLVELEGLCLGVEGKASLWRSLKSVAGTDTRLAVTDLDRLLKRAERQREELEIHRLEAARRALA